jgi:hypothetical protein
VISCGQIGLLNDEVQQKVILNIKKIVGRTTKVNLAVVQHDNV